MRIIVIAVLFLSQFTTTFAQDLESLKKEIEKIIFFDTEISLDKTPGYIIGIVVGDSTYVYSYGNISKEQTIPPNENTIFEIGGITKVFTASLVEILVQNGALNYEMKVNELLPKAYRNPKLAELNLLQLIAHQSGMPRMPLEFGTKEKVANNPYAYYTKKDLMEFYKEFSPSHSPKYDYSHVNYALVEVVLESHFKQSFESLLQTHLLQSFESTNTVIRLNDDQKARLATGYSVGGKAMPNWSFQSFGASEGLKSTMNDLLNFMDINLGKMETPIENAITATHLKASNTDIGKHTSIAKGWHLVTNKRYHDVIIHSGSTSGYRAFMGFVKETQTGVIVLTNSEYGTGGLGYLILKMINNNWKKR